MKSSTFISGVVFLFSVSISAVYADDCFDDHLKAFNASEEMDDAYSDFTSAIGSMSVFALKAYTDKKLSVEEYAKMLKYSPPLKSAEKKYNKALKKYTKLSAKWTKCLQTVDTSD